MLKPAETLRTPCFRASFQSRSSCLLVTCTWNNPDGVKLTRSCSYTAGNRCHLAVLAPAMECHRGPSSPWVPRRPTFSASVEVPEPGGVPGLLAEPPRSPVEQSPLCHGRSRLSHQSPRVNTLSRPASPSHSDRDTIAALFQDEVVPDCLLQQRPRLAIATFNHIFPP